MRFFYSVVVSFLITTASAGMIDSLETVLANTSDPDTRLSLISLMLENTIFQDVEAAEQYVARFRKDAEKFGERAEIARSYNFEGMLAYLRGQRSEAIRSYLIAIDHYQKLDDKFMIGMMYNNIGTLHESTDPIKGIEYLMKAKTAFESVDTLIWIANVNYNIATQSLALERYNRALDLFVEVIDQYGVLGEQSNLPACFAGIGKATWKLGNPDSALFFYNKALELASDDQHVEEKAVIHSSLCGIYTENTNYSSALENCQLSARYAEKYGSIKQLISSSKYRYMFHKKFGQSDLALEQLENWKTFEDSLKSTENEEFLAEMVTKYESAEKEKKIKIQELELQKSTQEKQFLWVIIALIGALLLGGIFFLRNKTRTNKKLQEQKALIEVSLTEKELLLKEIHHRVKNNLQVISSLLSIQSKGITDGAALEAVNESRNRVKSMALIHQNLYREDDLTGIDMQDYILKLGNSLIRNYKVDSNKVDFITEIDDISLDVDTTIPLGLILNELIANTLKYAFPKGEAGEVRIQLTEEKDELFLQVRDNGVGIAATQADNKEGSTGFGMKMIDTFSRKLKAKHKVYTDNGTVVELSIKNYKLVG